MKKLLIFILTITITLLTFSACKQEDAVCNHENLSHYKFDIDNHFKTCLDCGETVSLFAHTEYGDECSDCGFTNPIGTPGLIYTKIEGKNEYAVSGFKGNAGVSSVIIASRYEGCPVTQIGSSAFTNNSIIETVLVPYTITTISSYAFTSCTKLKSIKFVNKYGWRVYQSNTSADGEPISVEEISNASAMAIKLRNGGNQGLGRKFLKRIDE